MKNLRIYKLVQSVVLFCIGVGVCLVGYLFHGNHAKTDFYFLLLFWALLLLSLVGILLDMRFLGRVEHDSNLLRLDAFTDSLTGLMNHAGMDRIIHRLDQHYAQNALGCVVCRLENLLEVNESQGRAAGDALEQRFSQLLSNVTQQNGYICRNNASVYLILLPDCKAGDLALVTAKVDAAVKRSNTLPDLPPIKYRLGSALSTQETAPSISGLISIAYQRSQEE